LRLHANVVEAWSGAARNVKPDRGPILDGVGPLASTDDDERDVCARGPTSSRGDRHASERGSFLVTPDGTKVVARDDDGSIRVWDIATDQEVARLAG